VTWESLRDGVQRAAISAFALSEPATYKAQGGAPQSVRVIFRDQHSSLDVADGASVTTVAPVAHVRLGDLQASPIEGDELYVPGKSATYQVRDPQPDGEGMVKLVLVKIDP